MNLGFEQYPLMKIKFTANSPKNERKPNPEETFKNIVNVNRWKKTSEVTWTGSLRPKTSMPSPRAARQATRRAKTTAQVTADLGRLPGSSRDSSGVPFLCPWS